MATKIFKLYGKAHYAKVYTVDEKYGNFQCGLVMDKASLDLFKKSGLQLKLKDVDGEQYAVFRREPQKLIRGEMQQFGKPKVVDAVGREIEDLIGNGSDIAITVAVYDTMKGKGHRMETVQVNKLIPYNKNAIEDAHGDYDEDGDAVYEGNPEARKDPVAPPPKAGKPKAIDPNDAEELPF